DLDTRLFRADHGARPGAVHDTAAGRQLPARCLPRPSPGRARPLHRPREGDEDMTSSQTISPKTSSAEPAIVIRDLTKTFGPTSALDACALTAATGQVSCFIGPNGAGKSSTLRILVGLLEATDGQGTVLGMGPGSRSVQIHPRLAYGPAETKAGP